jgi:hypothetical protein
MRTRRFPIEAAALATALLLGAAATPAQAAATSRAGLSAWLADGLTRLTAFWMGATTAAGQKDVLSLARKGCAVDPNGVTVCVPEVPTPPPG